MDERERVDKRPAAAQRPPAARPPIASDALARLAGAAGNGAVAGLLRRGGAIMPSGTVHPDVQRLIGERAGRGGRLDTGMARWASETLDPAMPAVGVHTDATADALARSVAARAFTVRSDVFFAAGQYQPHTTGGRELIAHELTHVAQQRGAATSGPLRVSDPGDALERDADRIAGELHD